MILNSLNFLAILKRNYLREASNRKFIRAARDEFNHALFVAFIVEDVEDCGCVSVGRLFLVSFFGVI